jgi:hypothetical protein
MVSFELELLYQNFPKIVDGDNGGRVRLTNNHGYHVNSAFAELCLLHFEGNTSDHKILDELLTRYAAVSYMPLSRPRNTENSSLSFKELDILGIVRHIFDVHDA